jgi:hypothetical protein
MLPNRNKKKTVASRKEKTEVAAFFLPTTVYFLSGFNKLFAIRDQARTQNPGKSVSSVIFINNGGQQDCCSRARH